MCLTVMGIYTISEIKVGLRPPDTVIDNLECQVMKEEALGLVIVTFFFNFRH